MPFTFKNAQKAVATFALVGLFLFIAVLFLIGKGSDLFTFKDTYYTIYDDGNGLSSGTAIKYKSITIGKVKGIRLMDNDQIHISISIFSDYRRLIREDSVLKIQGSLLGSASLVLVPSLDSNSQLLLPGSMILSSDMEKGQEYILRFTKASPPKDDLQATAKKILDNIDNLKPVINTTLMNVRDITGEVKVTMKNIRELSAEINSPNNSIGALVRDKKHLSQRIVSLLDSVDKSLKNVNAMTEKLKDAPADIQAVMVLLRENLIESKKVLSGLKGIVGGDKEVKKTTKKGDRNE